MEFYSEKYHTMFFLCDNEDNGSDILFLLDDEQVSKTIPYKVQDIQNTPFLKMIVEEVFEEAKSKKFLNWMWEVATNNDSEQ